MKSDHLKVALGVSAAIWLACGAVGLLVGTIEDLQMIADLAAIGAVASALALIALWGRGKIAAKPSPRKGYKRRRSQPAMLATPRAQEPGRRDANNIRI